MIEGVGVRIVGELPTARGVTRYRLEVMVSTGRGPQLLANLNRSPEAAWITIESFGILQPAADRLAEAVMRRLKATNPHLAKPLGSGG